jgi:pimeloyl-ACP methyl ester carboxylesterase
LKGKSENLKKNPCAPISPDAKPGDFSIQPGQFKVGKATYSADIGALVVPENRSKPYPRSIALPVIRIRSRNNHSAEPVFWLEGGPGASNLTFKVPEWLLADHDVVMIGYRGVDGSSILACPEISRAFKGKGGDLLGPESRANIASAIARASRRLQDEGVDLEGYTIPEVVHDMEAARAALGYRRINLLSASYGTRIAQIYAYLHPASLHRSVMIGVNPPGHFVWEPQTIDAQLKYYSTLWAQDPRRAARTANLAETMRRVIHQMPRRWLLFPIDPGKVRLMTFAMLFHRGPASVVFDAFVAAARGDPSGLWMMSVACDFMLPNMLTWGHLLALGSSADYDPSRSYARELDPADAILGSPISLAIWGTAGDAWPIKLIPPELRRAQPSDIDTLLVSGSMDFSTPAEFATKELLPFLKKGRQIILREFGHVNDVFTLRPEAFERLVVSYFNTGDADDSLFAYLPMNFNISLGFPMLAKAFLGMATLLLLGLFMLVAFLAI